MKICLSKLFFKALAVSGLALFGTGARANSGSNQVNLVDMTTTQDLGGDIVLTTGFLSDFDVVAFDRPQQQYAGYDVITANLSEQPITGWAGIVEVETDEDTALRITDISAFSHAFTDTNRETRMSGFYTMRYQFETELPFRPYAGAGLGLVTTNGDDAIGGVVAGRATAGFDFNVGSDSALFAEYALVKSGGVDIGTYDSNAFASGSIPDIEHSLKFGFRRAF